MYGYSFYGARVDNRDLTNMKHGILFKEKAENREGARNRVKILTATCNLYELTMKKKDQCSCTHVYAMERRKALACSRFPEKPEQKRLGACSNHTISFQL